MAEYLRFDSPIHNLQVFLRFISERYTDIPKVIPDGVYGNNTKEAVMAFQEIFGLAPTGEIDNSSWDKITEVYFELENEYATPYIPGIYPEAGLREDYISYTPTILLIQTMLVSLSQRFDNIPEPSVSGVVDYPTIESINAVKSAGGLNPDGNINKLFWEYLSAIYSAYISSDRTAVMDVI